MDRAPLYVIVGPTAVGKGTVIRRLLEDHPEVQLSVSATTRPPRPGEVDGRDYFFVSDEEFDRLVGEDALLEWATVHQVHRYGTPADWVDEQRRSGQPVLLEVDLEGARQVRDHVSDAKIIFVAPPSWEELERRLRGRGTEGAEEQERRLRTARTELEAAGEFDAQVTNTDVNSTARELAAILGLD